MCTVSSYWSATSAIFDDQGKPKQKPERLRMMNNNTVILLTWDHKRDWIGNGDRIVRTDPYNYVSGEMIRPHLLVSHYNCDLQSGNLQWNFTERDSRIVMNKGVFSGITLASGEAREVGVVEVEASSVDKPTVYLLSVKLIGKGLSRQLF
jgi:hypothetical protein